MTTSKIYKFTSNRDIYYARDMNGQILSGTILVILYKNDLLVGLKAIYCKTIDENRILCVLLRTQQLIAIMDGKNEFFSELTLDTLENDK